MAQWNQIAALYEGFAFETVTVGTAAGGLSTDTYLTSTARAQRAVITCSANAARYTYDGVTTPTTGVGHLLNPNDVLVLNGRDNIDNFSAINAVSASAPVLSVTYERSRGGLAKT